MIVEIVSIFWAICVISLSEQLQSNENALY